MKVCVLNGSPRGAHSVTLHSVLYLQKKFLKDEFEILNVGQKIKYYEKNFHEIEESVKKADIILFAYPIYTFLAPSQLQKIIRLLKEKNLNVSGKFATQITTSKHFYDVTAHKYIEENCYDLGLKYIKGISADMDDMLYKKGQVDLVKFFNYVLFSIENKLYEVPNIIEKKQLQYDKKFDENPKTDAYTAVIITDSTTQNKSLENMIDDFKAIFPYKTKTVDLAGFPFSAGCLGCFDCVTDGKCIHKDGFDTYLRTEILSADAIVYAFEIVDHSMGPLFKCYDDRQFCNGHRFVFVGMPIGYLVSGNYEEETNVRFLIESRSEVAHTFLSGVATDSETLKAMVSKLDYSLKNTYYMPQTFYGVGGRMIFRDLIYVMRGFMKADHKFYKKHGIYNDLPQNNKGRTMLMMIVGMFMNNAKIRAKYRSKMNAAIIAPYKKKLEG